MNKLKLFAVFFLTSIYSLGVFAANTQETVVTVTINNKTNNPIESHLADVKKIEPNSSKTFSFAHDLKISDMHEGDSASFARGVIFFSPDDKSCLLSTEITLSKIDGNINRTINKGSTSMGKKPVGCSLTSGKESKVAPYDYSLELTIVDFSE
jgi:hypothetical protein